MLRLSFEIAVVSSYSRPGRSRPDTSITVWRSDQLLLIVTSGVTTKGRALPRVARLATTSGSLSLPSSTCTMVSPMRAARRASSSSRSYSRETATVSSASPSVVV